MLPINNETNNRYSFNGHKICTLKQKNEKLSKTILLSSVVASSYLKQYGTKYLKEVSIKQKILAALCPIMLGITFPNNINLDESQITYGKAKDKKVKNYLFLKQIAETSFIALIYLCSTPHKYLKDKNDKKSNIIAACLSGIALAATTISNIATWKSYKKENTKA